MPISRVLSTIARVALLVLVGLLAGSMFGIARGYDFASYTPATYLEVHQVSVRGLNVLLPALGLAAIVLSIGLAVSVRRERRSMIGFIVAAVLIAVAGLVTRLGNQPINDLVMGWTATTLPAGWEAIRDSWRQFHLVRLVLTLVAQVTLIVTMLGERRS